MGKPSYAPPPAATLNIHLPDQAKMPEPMQIPTPEIPDHPVPGDHGMPELSGPAFPELDLPDGAIDHAQVVLPPEHFPDFFGI
jgi:hypothetical protein